MNLLDELEKLGVDISDADKRLNHNITLYEKLLKKFPHQVEILPVLSCYENGDYKAALENAHTMKGMTSNLSMISLYNAYSEAVSLMRHDEYPEAIEKVRGIIELQQQIIDTINKYQ